MKTNYQAILSIIAGMAIMAIMGLIAKSFGNNTNKIKVIHHDITITNQDMQNILNFEAYTNANPVDGDIYKKKGYLNFKNSNYKEALLNFETALSLQKNDAYLLHLISETYLAMNQPENAKVYQKKAQDILYTGIKDQKPLEYKELNYSIQLGVFKNEPGKEFFQHLDSKQIKKETHESGFTVYTYGTYSSYVEAAGIKKELMKTGYVGIYITVSYAGAAITTDKALELEKKTGTGRNNQIKGKTLVR